MPLPPPVRQWHRRRSARRRLNRQSGESQIDRLPVPTLFKFTLRMGLLGTMKKSRLLRTAVLAMALCGWGLAARADLVYDVTGTFGTTTYTGPLNGGTF